MSAFPFGKKIKKTKTNGDIPDSKKPGMLHGEPMISKHSENQNVPKRLLRRFTHLYAHHRTALICVTILLLAGGGYVLYRSFAATPNTEPSEEQVYNYITNNLEKYHGIVIDPNTSHEVIRLPYVGENNKFENYVLIANPGADLSGRIYPFKPDNSNKRCFKPYTSSGRADKRLEAAYAGMAVALTGPPGTDPAAPGANWWTLAKFIASKITTNDAMQDGVYIDCNGSENETGSPAYQAAKDATRKALNSEGINTSHETFDISMACYSLYPKASPLLGMCKTNPGLYLTLINAKPAEAVFMTPAEEFTNYRQQLAQIALNNGASSSYIKALCNTYTDPDGCKTFIDQSCSYFHFCRDLNSNGPSARPVAAPVEPPRCKNGNLLIPDMYCDEGDWTLVFVFENNGARYETWRSPAGECGTKTGLRVGSLPARQGYMYHQNCDDGQKIQNYIQALFINDLAVKAQTIQDIKPLKFPRYGGPIDTDAITNRISIRNGNMQTWPEWEKRDKPPAEYCGYLCWFIPIANQHGLSSYNTTKGLNFMGNIWGYDQGRFVAASNMDAYGRNVGAGQAFVFGPKENPGGNLYEATAQGRKVMKVCWEVRDIAALESNNTVHSRIKLRITSNGGNDLIGGDYGTWLLSGTEFKEYCQDNIKITNPNVRDLEYPATYVDGAVEVSGITRTIYWPEGSYDINLPSYGTFGKQLSGKASDPLIAQANIPASQLTIGQCPAANFKTVFGTQVGVGCKITESTPLSVTSTIFTAPKSGGYGGKQLCVQSVVPQFGHLYAYIYGGNMNQPSKAIELGKNQLIAPGSRIGLCGDTGLTSFNRVVLSTNLKDAKNPFVVEKITVK